MHHIRKRMTRQVGEQQESKRKESWGGRRSVIHEAAVRERRKGCYPVRRVVRGMFKNGYARKSPLFSRRAMMMGVTPMFGTAIKIREGITCTHTYMYMSCRVCTRESTQRVHARKHACTRARTHTNTLNHKHLANSIISCNFALSNVNALFRAHLRLSIDC